MGYNLQPHCIRKFFDAPLGFFFIKIGYVVQLVHGGNHTSSAFRIGISGIHKLGERCIHVLLRHKVPSIEISVYYSNNPIMLVFYFLICMLKPFFIGQLNIACFLRRFRSIAHSLHKSVTHCFNESVFPSRCSPFRISQHVTYREHFNQRFCFND